MGVSATALIGNFYGTKDEKEFLYFFDLYLIEYDSELNETIYEYSINNKYLHLVNGMDQSEKDTYYIIDGNYIYIVLLLNRRLLYGKWKIQIIKY